MKLTIGQLVERARVNDQLALNELYNCTVKKAYFVARQLLADEDEIADVLQDAYVKAFRNLHMLDNPEKFQGWIDTIVINKCKDYLKRRRPVLFSELETDDENDSPLEFEDTRAEFLPEEAVDYGETKRLIREMIERLPEDQKMCLLLYYFEEKSVGEIASVMECSPNTVKSRLNYARKSIKWQVEDLEKKGTKLYCVPFVPFLYWFFRQSMSDALAQGMPDAILASVGAGVIGAGTGMAGAAGAGAIQAGAGTVGAGAIQASAGAAGTGMAGAAGAGVIQAGAGAAGTGMAGAAGAGVIQAGAGAAGAGVAGAAGAGVIQAGAGAAGVGVYQAGDRILEAVAVRTGSGNGYSEYGQQLPPRYAGQNLQYEGQYPKYGRQYPQKGQPQYGAQVLPEDQPQYRSQQYPQGAQTQPPQSMPPQYGPQIPQGAKPQYGPQIPQGVQLQYQPQPAAPAGKVPVSGGTPSPGPWRKILKYFLILLTVGTVAGVGGYVGYSAANSVSERADRDREDRDEFDAAEDGSDEFDAAEDDSDDTRRESEKTEEETAASDTVFSGQEGPAETIERFETAFNNADADGIIGCMTPELQIEMNASLEIMRMTAGLGGLDVPDNEYLLPLFIGLIGITGEPGNNEWPEIDIEIVSITYTDDTHADVETTIHYETSTESSEEPETFKMEKIRDEWYFLE